MRSTIGALISRVIIISSCLVVLLIFGACQRQLVPATGLQPEENLINIISELKLHQRDDLYRFSYPRDLAGHNIFKTTIVRLANYERLFPGKFPDIVAFCYALAYEKLGDFKTAAQYYEQVADMESPLSNETEKRLVVTQEFEAIISPSSSVDSMGDFIDKAEHKIDKLAALIEKYPGGEYETLARLEREREQVALANFLSQHRYLIRDGTQRAINFMKTIIDEHKESKNYYAHYLRLADFYLQLAKEYVDLNPPEGAEFSEEKFEEMINAAADLYFAVSQADGYREKEEGKAKLKALFSFANSVRQKM